MFLCQLSSGMRSGEILQLRKSDLDLTTKRIMVKLRPSIAKGNKARTTFFSKEAGSMLRNILRGKKDDELIFGTDTSTVTVVRQYNEQNLINYCKKVGLAKKYENSPRFKISSHSFRAFFITKMSRHDENLAKKLSGQTGYLLQYDRMNDSEKLELYMRFENDLTIYDNNKALTELEKIKDDKNQLASTINEMKSKLENLENEQTLLNWEKQSAENETQGYKLNSLFEQLSTNTDFIHLVKKSLNQKEKKKTSKK